MTVDLPSLRRSPLEHATHGTPERVLLRERAFLESIDLRLSGDGPAFTAIETALGIALPRVVGRGAHREPYTVLTLGPDWWLVQGEGAERQLREACGNAFASIVDVSAQRTCIEISGPRAVNVLQHGWDQDLDPVAFPVDRCSQGLIAKSPVLLHHIAPALYRLHVRASFAQHLWSFLTDAAIEQLSPN